MDLCVGRTVHLVVRKLVAKNLETVHVKQASLKQIVPNNVQYNVKITNVTKTEENVWHAKMAITVISVNMHALGTVKKDVENLQGYVAHAQRVITVVTVIPHVLKIAKKTTVQETVSVISVDQDTREIGAMNAVLKIAWETSVLKTVTVLSVKWDTEGGNAMNTVLKIVRDVSKLNTNVLIANMGGLVWDVPRSALQPVVEMVLVKSHLVNVMFVPLVTLAVSVRRHAVHIAM